MQGEVFDISKDHLLSTNCARLFIVLVWDLIRVCNYRRQFLKIKYCTSNKRSLVMISTMTATDSVILTFRDACSLACHEIRIILINMIQLTFKTCFKFFCHINPIYLASVFKNYFSCHLAIHIWRIEITREVKPN